MAIKVAIAVLLAGCVLTISGAGTGSYAGWFLSGTVYAAAFVPFLLTGPITFGKRFLGIWCAMAVAASFCTWTEYVIFVHASQKERTTALVGAQVLFAIFSAVLAALAVWLKVGSKNLSAGRAIPARRVVAAIAGGGLIYLAVYYVFGGLVFQFLTKPYYSSGGRLGGAVETVAALGWWFPLIQIGRGMLMTMAILPVLLGTRLPRMQRALYGGLLLWGIGGLAPLIAPVADMPRILREMHIFEIFTQNFPLGFLVTLVLVQRSARVVERETVSNMAMR